MMVSYNESKESRQTIVLVKSGVVVATFGNLKKVLEYLEGEKNIPSYWTLARKKFPIEVGEYVLFKVRHY